MITKFARVTASFIVPPVGGSVTVAVTNASWLSVGAYANVQQAGNFMVAAIPSSNLLALVLSDLAQNVKVGDVVPVGVGVGEGANPNPTAGSDPAAASQLAVISGGTGASTVAAAVANLGLFSMQKGTGTLALGTATIATATITGTSSIFIQRTSGPGNGAGVIGIMVTSVVPGAPGSFAVTAIDKDGNTITTDVGTFNWLVVG